MVLLMNAPDSPRITQRTTQAPGWVVAARRAALGVLVSSAIGVNHAAANEARDRFAQAWEAARSGDRAVFEAAGPGLSGYLLYPYWQYEDYRHRRARVPVNEMAIFLESHADWAFADGLRVAWLKSLGQRRQWEALVAHSQGVSQVTVRCLRARAQLETGQTDGLLLEAQSLWTVGHSQDKACDPVFDWLQDADGITTAIAWERIRLAMREGNPRFTLYLARFLPPADREWLSRWQELSRTRYRRLDRVGSWPDTTVTRMITAESLRRLARSDPEAALRTFAVLDSQFRWDDAVRGDLMREIGLMAAVDLLPEAMPFIASVPSGHQNDQLLQWWARTALAAGDWAQVHTALSRLSDESHDDGRWQYWRARALMATGEVDVGLAQLEALSAMASFHGFLAADDLQRPYALCPREPVVTAVEVEAMRQRPDIARALELRAAGIDNWALSEWTGATRRLDTSELKVAAAVAREEAWHDRAIFALGDSGELRFYDWRFPLLWTERVASEAQRHQLDPAWILGVMRAESAMTESARSSANALGLMQVTPGTARQISRKHGLPYRGTSQLLVADENIQFGSVYLRELMDRFDNNPVLVSAAYNAGPEAVERWLKDRPVDEAAIWAEILPYYETRDYIPRVLAFTTIYEWRLDNDVPRVSARMPGIESGTLRAPETTEVVCPAPERPVASP